MSSRTRSTLFLLLLCFASTVVRAQFAPAPFRLSMPGRTNPTLYRMDHTSRLPGCLAGQGLELDTLRLQWRPSVWTGADTGRNNPADPVRYEWNVIVDTSEAQRDSARTGITYTFPSWNNGADPELRLSGDVMYPALFHPTPWPVEEPDSIVMRVRWFVRAYNSVGSVYSDTAGHTVHRGSDSSTLTPALMLSYNRLSYYRPSQFPPQYWRDILPTPVQPVDSGVLAVDETGIGHVIWTVGYDRNIVAGQDIGGFRWYSRARRLYLEDPSGRTVDTLLYQWTGTVVRTVPPGRGAAPGTRMVINTGATSGFQITKQQTDSLLGVHGPGGADSVVLDWQVFVKDAAWTDNVPIEAIPFPYELDGTLRADTGLWSRYGCRPHVVASKVFRATLARKRWAPAPFLLSPAGITNPDLFRLSYVNRGAACTQRRDSLLLRWQEPRWSGADSGRTETDDTVRYEWVALLDKGGSFPQGAPKISFPSADNGRAPWIVLGTEDLARAVFRAAGWPASAPHPDSLVIRLRWFVRASNSVGVTHSDTAGYFFRRVPTLPPTPALLLSYNEPPDPAPAAVLPADDARIVGLETGHVPLPFEWTTSGDRNVTAGTRIGGLFVWNPTARAWTRDANRTVDTVTYQWIAEVIETQPAGTGAPVGTTYVAELGAATTHSLLNSVTVRMFGSLDPLSPTGAFVVVLRWRVDAKDCAWTDNSPIEQVPFRYNPDGTVRGDTAMWSEFGCQPHLRSGAWRRLTLVRAHPSAAETPATAASLDLAPNYPNPITGHTTFPYTLTRATAARLLVTDLLGRDVVVLADGVHEAGSHYATWDGCDAAGRVLPAGAYIARLLTADGVRERIVTIRR